MESLSDQQTLDEVEKTILLVDDEPNIIKALKRLLRRDGYTILTATDGRTGLDMLAHNKVGVILSDQRMPEMSGVEFLSQVKELYPDTVRMVLSGYTDLNTVTDAINQGAIYKFLTKPWEDGLLRANIKDAFQHFRLVRENRRLHAELKKLNQLLENRLDEQNRLSKIELHMLQLNQAVLDNQPVAVLGIGDDQMIAVANNRAHELLNVQAGSLLTAFANQVLPQEIQDAYTRIDDDTEEVCTVIRLNKIDYQIICRRLTAPSGPQGLVITLFPRYASQIRQLDT